MRYSFFYTVAGFFFWATMTPVLAQNTNVAPSPTASLAPESKITAESKLQDKTLKEWVADIKATDPSVQRVAIQSVIMYGRVARTDAVPAIISILNNRSPGPEVSLKVNGVMALGLIGMNDKDLKNGVPCLINLLNDSQAIVRLYAVGALARLGPDTRSAIPYVVNLTKAREDSEIRQAAVNALRIMAWDKNSSEGPDPRAFRAISLALGDHCIQVRYEAIKALIMIGPPAIPNDNLGRMAANADRNNAISKLESLLSQRDKVQAVWAQMALMRMDLSQINDSNLKAMAKILKLGDSHVRCNAAQALAMAWMLAKRVPNSPNPNSIAPKSGWGVAINELMERLSDKDLQVVSCGINALGEFGVAAMKAKPQLEILTQHNDQLVREAAKAALVKITGREKMNLGEANRGAP